MNRKRAVQCLHEELGAWPKPTTLRADVPDVCGWRWDADGESVSLVPRDGMTDPITEADWLASSWVAGEKRMEAIGPNGPTGDHYAEDSDGESALSQALREQDAGAHYRREYKGIKLDPYRIAKIYGMAGGPREQIMKKCLRFTDKGQAEQQVVDEIRTALNRWQEMLEEDGS